MQCDSQGTAFIHYVDLSGVAKYVATFLFLALFWLPYMFLQTIEN